MFLTENQNAKTWKGSRENKEKHSFGIFLDCHVVMKFL